jgi:hypothetical protein
VIGERKSGGWRVGKSKASSVRRGIRLSIAPILLAATAGAIQTTIGGHHVDLDATLSVREMFETNRATTHERTLEQLGLRAAVSFTDWLRFDSTTVGSNGGPTMKADRSGVYTLDDTFQDVSPALEFAEAYFDVFLPSVDLRLGKQKVAWGKLDRFQPNDLINPLAYNDPFLQEEAERKIGVPALQATYYVPTWPDLPEESRLTAVWVPQYVPYRFPLSSCEVQNRTSHCDIERWFPPAAMPPSALNVPGDIVGLPAGQSIDVPLAFHTQNSPTPGWRVANNEIGLRYSGLLHDVDFALYYYHGFDVQPAFRLQADVIGSSHDLRDLTGATTLSPVFKQIDSGGADFAYAFDRFTVRGEGAFVSGRPFPRDLRFLISDPHQLTDAIRNALEQLPPGGGSAPVELPDSFVVHDALEWGVGGDYVYEGYLLLLQVNQTDVFHNDVQLLIKDVDTRLLANLRKNFLHDTLETQLVALYGIESDYTFVRPRLLYRLTDHLAAEAGYLFIAGRSESVVGQYKRNGEAWVRLEYKL